MKHSRISVEVEKTLILKLMGMSSESGPLSPWLEGEMGLSTVGRWCVIASLKLWATVSHP